MIITRAFAFLSALCLCPTAWSQASPQIAPVASKTAPGAFVDVEAGKLYYEECGTGPDAVILIHDGIAHSAVWDEVWPTFCKRFHTIRYDRRGYGRTTPVIAFIDSNGPEKNSIEEDWNDRGERTNCAGWQRAALLL